MTATATVRARPSDLGQIPDDWATETLAGLGGQVTSGSRGWATFYAKYGDLFVRITNLRRDNIHLDLADQRFVLLPALTAEAARTRLREGDLLVSITADIGIIGYVDEHVPSPAYINQHIARVRLPADRVSPKFVAYYLASWAPQRTFVGATDTGAKAGMNLTTVGALKTVVPPLPEQIQIAATLSDVDEQIAALQRLITKKEAIARGMMQELLTGRTRLPGFRQSWREWPMGSIGSAYGGLTGKTKEDFGNGSGRYVPFIAVMAGVRVTARSLLSVRVAPGERQNVVRPRDILLNTSSETPDELAMCAVADDLPEGTHLNSFCFGFRISATDEADSLFVAYLFRSGVGRKSVQALAQGAIRYNLSKAQFRRLVVTLPPVDEQRAIAAVLSDADREIDTFRIRLRRAHAVKQGMMQQLLTGRTRLRAMDVVA